jgi:hypothetical protein
MSRLKRDYYLKHHILSVEAAWVPFGMTGSIVCDTEEGGEFAVSVVTPWKDSAAWVG